MKKYLIGLMVSISAFSALAKTSWTGPAGAACEFDLNGKHYVGKQYATKTQGGGSLNATQGWGCSAVGRSVQEQPTEIRPDRPNASGEEEAKTKELPVLTKQGARGGAAGASVAPPATQKGSGSPRQAGF